MQEIAKLLANDAIRPVVAQRFPFEDIAAAHTKAASNSSSVVISMRQTSEIAQRNARQKPGLQAG